MNDELQKIKQDTILDFMAKGKTRQQAENIVAQMDCLFAISSAVDTCIENTTDPTTQLFIADTIMMVARAVVHVIDLPDDFKMNLLGHVLTGTSFEKEIERLVNFHKSLERRNKKKTNNN